MGHDFARAFRVSPFLRLAIVCLVCGIFVVSAGFASAIAPGDPLWLKRYDGPAHGSDFVPSLASSPDGTKVFVTGTSEGLTYDYATIAYDAATGAKVWVKRYDGPAHLKDQAFSVAASPDGTKVFVTGWSEVTTGVNDYATVAYDASTGARLWVRRYNGPSSGNDVVYALAASPDRVFVTGGSFSPTSYADFATVAYDATTGATRWVKRYDGPSHADDYAYAIAASPDGTKVVVTGESGFNMAAIVAYDASTGARLWVRRYAGPNKAIAVSPDGTKVFGGSDGDFATGAYNAATGAKLWAKVYGDSCCPSSIATGPDGTKVFVTGSVADQGGGADYATVAYDSSTGGQLWDERYHGPIDGVDIANSVAASLDAARVFVTGGSDGAPGNPDYATVAYDASTGTQLWVQRYDGPGHGGDSARSVGISPDGTEVFVTGDSAGPTGTSDYATIAYAG